MGGGSAVIKIDEYVIAEAKNASGFEWTLGEYLDHLSPSSLSMLRRCPRQFQERYLFGKKERPAEAPLIGTAVHAGLELNFGQKITSGVDMPTAELLGWYSDVGFDATIEAEQQKGGGEVAWDTDPERAKTRGRVMLGEYHNLVAPRIQPVSVEGSFSVNLGAPVPVVGRFDVERAESVIDLKTGKRKTSKPKEAWRIQGAVYNLARGKPVEFHSLSATENNAVSIVTPLEAEELLVSLSAHELSIMAQDVQALAALACLLMELYGVERPWPTWGRFHDWACSYCGFRSQCPAWSNE